MESHVASSKIHLLKALEFLRSRVAPYILSLSNVTTHSSGASLYGSGSTGSRVCRFEINTSVGAMLDLSTLVVSGRVHNLSVPVTPSGGTAVTPAKPVKFLSPSLSGLLSSARITIGGVEVSSCDLIARTEHMLSLMQTDSDRRSDFASGSGLRAPQPAEHPGDYHSDPIAPNSSGRRLEA